MWHLIDRLFRTKAPKDEQGVPYFPSGARVRLSRDHSWAAGARGFVCPPPRTVISQTWDSWKELFRVVTTLDGTKRTYWVEFTRPQFDPEGCAVIAAEVDAKYLRETLLPLHIPNLVTPQLGIEETFFETFWYENDKLNLKVEFRVRPKRDLKIVPNI
jgi:hypothetical protein